MKNIKSLLFFFLTLSFFILSCSKDPASNSSKPILFLSKTTVKIGEPVFASLTGQASKTNVAWTSNSGDRVWPTPTTDSAIYIFTSAGTYTVKAKFQSQINGSNDSTDGNIMVTDSIFSDTVITSCNVIVQQNLTADDQINLIPVDYSDTGLVFLAQTSNLYNHSPLLNSNGEIHISESGFEVDISSALIFPCTGSTAPAPARGLIAITGLTNRTYTLSFKVNNTTYPGTMTVTDTNITFNWTYSSGVTISPLIIQRRVH
ncbi:MAG TPA: hypothetical protein VGH64_13160 [Puia sp.]